MRNIHISGVLCVLSAYFALTIAVGWISRSRTRTAGEFLNASHSLPLWVVIAAYLASNCGALEVVGLSAMAAQYGVQAFHFYWIGAIPAMIVLALFMMPVYRRSGVRSVPEYLQIRYGPSLRLLNAATTAILLLLLSGVSLYAMAQVLQVVLGFSFQTGVLLCAGIVLVYVLVGGLKATIYNEVLQLGVMLAGLTPLAIRSAAVVSPSQLALLGTRAHLWTHLPLVNQKAPMDVLGLAMGLGFVLSFGYWCTDFILMQRAFTARTENEARQVPLWAGFGKLAFSMIVVLPGLAAMKLLPELGHAQRFDQAMPALMRLLYSPALLALGLTALAASLMSGLAANVSAFAALWTQDIYRTTLQPHREERHYLAVGRIAIVLAMLAGIAASFLNFLFANLMEHVQLMFSVLGAPFWAVFLLGMLTRRTDERGALIGFVTGAALSFMHSILSSRGLLHYGSIMASNFYGAIYAFTAAAVVSWFASNRQSHIVANPANTLLLRRSLPTPNRLWILSGLLLVCCTLLNVYWR